MSKKIYILCPANIESGGPELTHQMCNELNNQNQEAYMYYISESQAEPIDVNACKKYEKYNTKHISNIKELYNSDSVVLFNEGSTSYIPYINNCQKILWWLSVDNYILCSGEKDIDIIKEQISFHLVQSYYAYNYVKNTIGINEENIIYLSDYIGNQYLIDYPDNSERMNAALFNPKKGLDKIKPLIEATPFIKWIPLIDMTEKEMWLRMHLAKIYVDFGNHPGKDRIPRETASCGCCVITNMEGSAAYNEDMPIPKQYKYSNPQDSLNDIICLLKDICDNFEKHYNNFKDYRTFIRKERLRFKKDVKRFINIINGD